MEFGPVVRINLVEAILSPKRYNVRTRSNEGNTLKDMGSFVPIEIIRVARAVAMDKTRKKSKAIGGRGTNIIPNKEMTEKGRIELPKNRPNFLMAESLLVAIPSLITNS